MKLSSVVFNYRTFKKQKQKQKTRKKEKKKAKPALKLWSFNLICFPCRWLFKQYFSPQLGLHTKSRGGSQRQHFFLPDGLNSFQWLMAYKQVISCSHWGQEKWKGVFDSYWFSWIKLLSKTGRLPCQKTLLFSLHLVLQIRELVDIHLSAFKTIWCFKEPHKVFKCKVIR